MAKSFKFKDDFYLDSSNIMHNKIKLDNLLNDFYGFKKEYFFGVNKNCDDITSSGIYIIDVDCTIINRPQKVVNNIESMIVFETSQNTIVLQIWFNYNNALYYRWKWWGNWSSWKQISTS